MRGVKSNASDVSVFHKKRNAGQLFFCWKKDTGTAIAGNCLFLYFTCKMLLLLASMSCIIQHSFAYNVETELPVIRRGDAGSYFGFSVANHAFEGYFDLKNHSWLLVGAPKANNSEVAEIASPGVVYRCDFRNDPGCEEVPFDKKVTPLFAIYSITGKCESQHEPIAPWDSIPEPPGTTFTINILIVISSVGGNTDGDRKDNSWFGVSVISAGYNGYVMACTHRLLHIEGSFYTYPGRCIGTASLEEKDLRTTSYETCEQKNQNKANQGGPDTINYKEHKYCQMGVAASILKSENVPLAGAPGAYNYQGEFIYLKRPQQEVFKNNSEHGYQGYSLTHGSFFKKDKDDVVSGAPRFNHHGMVVVFRNLGQGKFHSTPTVLLPPEIMEGSEKRRQPGTGFGLALCAADLNNDGLSELLVGAPFYSDDLHPEQGKVYSYDNRGDGNLVLSLELTVKKDKWRANFGRALASVGDLDLDGYRDVAIGAPYEDGGEGVVYIYRGSKNGLVETPMQVIKGSSVSPGIKSFGYSLSGRLDMDFNGYSDILIGAYQSDTVVLLRSKPVISLSSTININPDTFDIKGPKTCNATTQEGNTQFATYCFSISVCTKYTERSGNVTDKIDVLLLMNSDIDYVVESSKRVLFKANKKDEINRTEGILNSDKTCFTWEAYIREGVTDADVYPDIKFKLTYQIVKKTPPTPGSPTELPSLVPYSVLDPAKPQEATALLTFKRDCIKCVPDLILDDSKSKRTLAVGAETYKLKVTVTNKGDDAYNAKLYVTIPKGIKIGRIFTLRDTEGEDVLKGGKIEETKLDSNDTLLSIKLNTPLKKKEQSIQIELRTERYADSPDFLPIYLSANSTNEEDKKTLADNERFLNISIKSQADLEVNGTTVEEQVSYGGKVVGESAMVRASDIGNQVKHKYFVKNRGPDPVPSTDIVIQWPFEAPSGKHLLYLIAVQFDDKRVKCDFKPGQLNMLGLETSLSGNSGQQQNDTSEDAGAKKRRRREADDNQEESSTKVKREADPPKAEKLQTDLDCKLGSAKCTNIHCTINFLQAGDDVTFTIVSRLWNGTMIEDYEGQLLRVISHATVRSLNTYVQETNKDNNKAQVGTQLNPDADVAVPSKGLPKWVIPVCVAGAILLLVLIVFCLYKLGFFKRQKYDKNITNPEEAEGMLDNGKGYHV